VRVLDLGNVPPLSVTSLVVDSKYIESLSVIIHGMEVREHNGFNVTSMLSMSSIHFVCVTTWHRGWHAIIHCMECCFIVNHEPNPN